MENNVNLFLPKYTFDQIEERVCSKISNFRISITWKGIPELCMKIEAEPRAVDSVIRDAKQNFTQAVVSNIYQYQLVLARVYMLLYYRHRDDEIYKQIVFPELIKNIEPFANNTLRTIIQPEINKILELDQLVEKAQTEEKKNLKPVFAYVDNGRIEQDHLYIEYCKERLFLEISDTIKKLSKDYATLLDETNVWYNAKQVVHTLRDISHPEYLIERAAVALVDGQIRHGYEGAQMILLCVYAMVRSAKEDSHFAKFISAMEALSFKDTDMSLLKQNIKEVKSWIDSRNPFDGYDYIGDIPNPVNETFTRADIDLMVSDYTAKIEALEKQLAQKNKALEELKMKQEEDVEHENTEEVDWHDKVRLDLLLRLMKKDGANLEKHGNKVKAANVMQSVTNLPLQTCKNYCSSPILSTTEHEEEILKLNTNLQALGMETRL